MEIPPGMKYTSNDEWLRMEGKIGIVGITDYAQHQLSDIVFVEIVVNVGDVVKKGETCATVESVKAAADVYLPAGGKIVEINDKLPEKPETINNDPYGDAWMVKLEITSQSEVDSLLDEKAYQAHLASKE